MKRATHILFGVALASWIIRGDPLNYTIGLFATTLGSVLPDIDLRFKHRKSMHNVFSTALIVLITHIALPEELFRETVVLGLALGMGSHLLLDFVTKRGVALFYPVSGYLVRLGLCKSESITCNILFSATSLALLALRFAG